MPVSVWLGWDPREASAFAVARHTLQKNAPSHWPIYGLVLSDLQKAGLYTRPIEMRQSAVDKPVMWDVVSDAPMATEHACSRFLVPHLAKNIGGWAMFADGDTLFRSDVGGMIDRLDPKYAVYCVKHKHEPPAGIKMDGQEQTRYARKNWSSVMVFNAEHPANKALTLEAVNVLPGRDLHRMCWLDDAEIGELHSSWNWLVGHSDPEVVPDVVHFTSGIPDMQGYENVSYSEEWREERNNWARGALSLPA